MLLDSCNIGDNTTLSLYSDPWRIIQSLPGHDSAYVYGRDGEGTETEARTLLEGYKATYKKMLEMYEKR